MDDNNFKRLIKMEEERLETPPNASRNIQHTAHFLGFIGHMVEMFMPRVVDVFISMNGGEKDTKTQKREIYTPDRNNGSFPRNTP